MQQKKIPVIIPHFRQPEKLKRCLNALETQDYQPLEIFVRDNSEDNILFTAAINEGLMKYLGWVDVDYVLLLNQDAYVDRNTIPELVKTLERNPKNGIACPIQYDEANKMTWGGSLNAFPAGVHNCSDMSILSQDMPTYWANGAAMLLRLEMVRNIGVLDENMRFICSDADYSFTARSRGWNVMVSSKSKIFHGFDGSHSVTNLALEKVKLQDMRYFAAKWLTGGLYKSLSYEGAELSNATINQQLQAIDSGLFEINDLIKRGLQGIE